MNTYQRFDYDAIVVGSGAGGGMAAYTLAQKGIRVLMLEAGRDYDPIKETPMFQTVDQAPLMGTGTPDKPFGFYDATVDGGWEVPNEPYTQASDKEDEQFKWWRARMLGGRRNKAKRGELRFRLPIGFCWEDDATIVLDPDLEVQNAVRNVFRFFEETGSGYGVAQRFAGRSSYGTSSRDL